MESGSLSYRDIDRFSRKHVLEFQNTYLTHFGYLALTSIETETVDV